MKRTIMCAVLAASAFVGATVAAQAEDAQMRVKIGDLNLATADGAGIALARIRAGANIFCEVGSGREPLDRVAVESRCVADMTGRSVRDLNAPLVTALLNGQAVGGASPAAVALAAK